jgi:L-galactose dehydrogenase/L-glyceraldehyde 3-phosphate reductase
MHYRPLGSTGIQVSVISFGAGPIAGLMTSPQRADDQRRTIARAIELGVNWFDTAATYAEGRSEECLGRALSELGQASNVYVATKVRLPPEQLHDIPGYIRRSVEASLQRLQLPSVTLLQLHNSVTAGRGDLATSVTPADVLEGGVLATFEHLRREGLVKHLGLTALGDPESLAAVLLSRKFAAVQIPYNILNPSAGRVMPPGFAESNLGNLLATCLELNVGALAIRVYAGGALAGQAPSPHTLTTKFFPLDLYQRDQVRARALAQSLPPGKTLPEIAVRFVLGHPVVTSALIGFGSPQEVEQAVEFADRGPLAEEEHVDQSL